MIRESDKRLHGPYTVIRVDGKEVYVEIDNHLRRFNVSQVILERSIDAETQINEWKSQLQPFMHTSTFHRNDPITTGPPTTDVSSRKVSSYEGPITCSRGKNQDASTNTQIFITEILHPADPRSRSPEFQAAKKKEIEGLVKRGTWKIVVEDDVPNLSLIHI